MTAGPLSSTCSRPPAPGKNFTATTPPGTLTCQSLGAVVAGPVTNGDGGGARTGAAGLGLPHTSLVHAHGDGSYAVLHQRLCGNHELDVGSVDRLGIHHGGFEKLRGRELAEFGQCNHRVRVAHADREAGPGNFQAVCADQGIHGLARWPHPGR